MHSNVNPARYVTALQLVLMVAASFCISILIDWSTTLTKSKIIRRAGLVLGLAFLGFVQFKLLNKTLRTLPWFDSPLHRVAPELAVESDKRFMVRGKYGTGSHFHRDLLPMMADRAQLQSYALGYHATFSTYYAEHLELEPVSLRLFNVNTLLVRNHASVSEPFVFHRGIGPYKFYRVPNSDTWSYFDLVWPGPTVTGNLRELRPKLHELAPKLFSDSKIAFLGPEEGVGENRVLAEVKTSTTPGSITNTIRALLSFAADVDAKSGAWLLFKMNYFPFWKAYVDDISVPVHHVAPNFMAVSLPTGKHYVEFRYENPVEQKLGFIMSLLLLLSWFLISWRQIPKKII